MMLLWSGFELINCLWKRGFINPCPWFIPRSKNPRESGRENGAVTSSKFGMLQQLGQKALVVPLQRVIKTKGCHIENMRFYLFFLRKKKNSSNKHARLRSFDHNAFQSLSLRFHTFRSIVALKVFIHSKTLRFWALFWMGRVLLFCRLWKNYLFVNVDIYTHKIYLFGL